jgi:hypothetical protein
MCKWVMTVAVVLLSSVWMMAQYGSQSSGSMSDQSSAGNAANHLEGCLSGSNGNYTLTDNAGNSYKLSGDSSELDKYNGSKVRVMGSMAAAGSAAMHGESGMGAAGSSGSSSNTFNVTKVKKTGSCGASNSTAPPSSY